MKLLGATLPLGFRGYVLHSSILKTLPAQLL